MKKNYITPSILIVDVNVEAIMQCCSTNFKDNGNSGVSVTGQDITGVAGDGTELDAAGYRSNLWGD